jgi:hypothetical protein
MNQEELSQDRIKEILIYNAETGIFIWSVSAQNKSYSAGDVAGRPFEKYLRITIDGRKYMVHRLAWLYEYGEWPKNQIDHINGIWDDNRISNLRDVTHRTNQENQRKARSNNATGLLGVTNFKGRFRAGIRVNKVLRYLGLFDTKEEAQIVYLRAKRKYHEGCTI